MKTKESIKKIREQIDEVDRQFALLCKKRLALTKEVFALKSESHESSIDPSREQAIVNFFQKELGDQTSAQKITRFVCALLSLSHKYPD